MVTGRQPPPPPPPPPPTASDIRTTDGSTVQGTIDVQQSEIEQIQNALTPLAAARLHDPGLANVLDTEAVPAPAAQTGDPHRVTFLLPNSDHTVFSLGAAATDTARVKEPGIRGRTDHHVHFQVAVSEKTSMWLGTAMVDADATPTGGWFCPAIWNSLTGYAMVTEGAQWHESRIGSWMVSREGDVHVRSVQKDVDIKSDVAKVHITGKKGVAVSAAGNVNIGASGDVAPEDKRWRQYLEGTVGDLAGAKFNQHSMKVLDFATAVYSLCMSFRSAKKKAKEGQSAWEAAPSLDKAKMVVDGAKLVSQVGRFCSSWWKDGQVGTVSISAETYAGLTGGMAASMYGGLSASMTSLLSASVLGGTAGVKGLAWASVWSGLGTSVKSIKDVSLESEFAKTKVKAKKDVDIAAEEGKVVVAGNTLAQLSGVAGAAGVHGCNRGYIGAGSGDGYGLIARPASLVIGKVSSAKDVEKAAIVDEDSLNFGSSNITLRRKNSRIIMKDDWMSIQSGRVAAIKVNDDGTLNAKGSKVLIA